MSKIKIIFKIIEHKPTITNINDYNYQIICHDTKFNDYIYCNRNNDIYDIINSKKSLKYIIKLMKKEKMFGIGHLIINQDIFIKKIKQKIYNNITLFITENNYKAIFPKSNVNNIKQGITLSLKINIIYNYSEKVIKNEKPKEIEELSMQKKIKLIKRNYSFIKNEKQKKKGKEKLYVQKKLKLIKRNFSFQKNEYSIKSTNNYLTTITSNNVYSYNNINNCYDSDNISETNLHFFSSDKLNNINHSNENSPSKYYAPFSEPNFKKKKKKIIKKVIISSISFKNNKKKNKNLKIFSNNLKYNIDDLKNRIKLSSSRNKKFLFNKNKINLMMTRNSSSSKSLNTITSSSIINSVLIEKDNNYNNIINNNNDIENKELNNLNNNNNDIFIYNNVNKYNSDNDDFDNYLIEIKNKKNRLFKNQEKINKILFNQEEIYNKIKNTLNVYQNKINNNKSIINQIKYNNIVLDFKNKLFCNNNKRIIPIISKVKESKEIENNIINLILNNNGNNQTIKNNNIENYIQKYNKNLMIKILKNIIQNNHNIDIYLGDEYNNKLKYICNKYNIFSSIIEENEE